MSLADDRARALEFVRERGFTGDELPPGVPESPAGCSLGVALGVEVWEHYPAGLVAAKMPSAKASMLRVGDEVVKDKAVVRFVQAFDRGRYRDLVA